MLRAKSETPTPTNEWLMERAARLAIELGKMATRYHRTAGHAGPFSQCLDTLCARNRAVLERNEK